jgi:predicted O-methyltransferase YrrM
LTTLFRPHVARRLIAHPGALTTVGALLRRDTAASAATPWWNERAVRYLSQHLRRGSRVFEWGSGASTVWLMSQGAEVTSIEHNPDWRAKVVARCPSANVQLIPGTAAGHVTTELGDGQQFYDDYVAAIDRAEDASLDVVIVDGMSRLACAKRAVPKLRPGGLLVVDDTDMRCFKPARTLLPGWRAVSQTGFKPTRELRETTFLHKPVPAESGLTGVS